MFKAFHRPRCNRIDCDVYLWEIIIDTIKCRPGKVSEKILSMRNVLQNLKCYFDEDAWALMHWILMHWPTLPATALTALCPLPGVWSKSYVPYLDCLICNTVSRRDNYEQIRVPAVYLPVVWKGLAGFDSRVVTFSKPTDRPHSVSVTLQEGQNTTE